MKKGLVILMAVAMVFAFAGIAMAKGDIEPKTYDLSYKDWNEKVQGATTGNVYQGFSESTHKYGTWNSPFTLGIDGYNYNDAQDDTGNGNQADLSGDGNADIFQSGPHGGYLTSTHRCRECHAVHRAAGKFKLLRSDTRFEACDWCHGVGAGSGFNIQMDNDDNFTTEYNVGHTMGFGISSGKWKAPDDTYPAFTPNYWQGGFSCFDCHSPHANPQRILGFNDNGEPVGLEEEVTIGGGPADNDGDGVIEVFGIANPGHANLPGDKTHHVEGPIYLSGGWILIKNADREIATTSTVVASGITGEGNVTITEGVEIPDVVTAALNEYSATTAYPVNKVPIDWDSPVGAAGTADPNKGFDQRSPKRIWNVSEFCTDCHDGNAGLHTVGAPLFSEDRALRNQGNSGDNWKGSYDIAYGHDAQPRH